MSIRHRFAAPLLVTCITVALLIPFADKAFHIDDTLFLYAARQIRQDPARPYEFTVNWTDAPERMWEVTKNPPLASYVLAGATWAFGERERPLHLSFIVFALIATLSTYWLARRLGADPFLSALILAISPGFLVCATSVSSDVPALAFFVLAVAAFVHGSQEGNRWLLALAGLAAGLSSVTKYIGITAVPLLAAYTILRERRLNKDLLWLLISVGIFGVWAADGWVKHGLPHFLTACTYSAAPRSELPFGIFLLVNGYRVATTLSFFAGTMGLTVFLCVPGILGRTWPWMVAACAVVASLALAAATDRWVLPINLSWPNWMVLAAFFFGAAAFAAWAMSGVAAAGKDWIAERWLLVLWLLGVLIFSAFFNWTVAVRVLIFAVPPTAILLGQAVADQRLPRRWIVPMALVTGAIGLLVCISDYRWADSYRRVAARTAEELGQSQRLVNGVAVAEPKLYFCAHWGLQYYMEKAGGQFLEAGAIDQHNALILLTVINKRLSKKDIENLAERTVPVFAEAEPAPFWILLQNREAGFGFYTYAAGPLPYGVSVAESERFVLCRTR